MNNLHKPSNNNSVNRGSSKLHNRMRFAGATTLIVSVVGVLLSIGGQLDFIGQERPEVKAKKKMIVKTGEEPKYSFYEDLKKRKTEIDNSSGTSGNSNNTKKRAVAVNDNLVYLVQIGSFKHQSDAETIRKKAKILGFKVNVVKRKSRFVTQAGPFRGKKAATKAEDVLQAAKFPTLIRRVK